MSSCDPNAKRKSLFEYALEVLSTHDTRKKCEVRYDDDPRACSHPSREANPTLIYQDSSRLFQVTFEAYKLYSAWDSAFDGADTAPFAPDRPARPQNLTTVRMSDVTNRVWAIVRAPPASALRIGI